MQGTIPYLGTFLTDLVMLDTAMKDFLDVRTSVPILLPLSFLHPGIPTAWSGKWGRFPVHLTLPPCESYIQRFPLCPISSAAPCASHTQRCPCLHSLAVLALPLGGHSPHCSGSKLGRQRGLGVILLPLLPTDLCSFFSREG